MATAHLGTIRYTLGHLYLRGMELNTSQVDRQCVVEMTEDVVPQVVEMHLQAFDGYMSTRLGPTYVNALIRWFYNSDKTISLVALDDTGKPAGYVIGAPVGYTVAMNRDIFRHAALATMSRPALLFDQRILRTAFGRIKLLAGKQAPKGETPELLEPTMSLVGIGVSPHAQGAGIGRQLVEAFEARSRELGARSMRLSVYPDNPAARRLYEKCGWQAYREPSIPGSTMFYFHTLGITE